MPRINVVEKSRKEKVCGGCQETIPVGVSYRWIKPRYGGKQVRCMKPACVFKPTDLSTSKVARIEEAIDSARDIIEVAESIEDIKTQLQEVADVAREVADEYQEASDNWAGGNGHEEFQEKADTCNGFADDLEGWEYSGDEDEESVRQAVRDEEEGPEQGESEEEYAARLEELEDTAWEERLQEMRDEAIDALDGLNL